MVPPFRGNAQGNAQGNQNLTRTQGGVSQKQQGGCPIPPFHFAASLFVFSSYDRPTRTAPAVRGKTGATPQFCAAGAARRRGGVSHGVRHRVSPPRLRGGRSRLYVSLPEGSPARTRAGRRATTSAAMLDRRIRCVPGRRRRQCRVRLDVARRVFPRPIPWRCSSAPTPRTCIAPSSRGSTSRPAWPCFLAGQLLISTSRIWFARMGVHVGLRSRLPSWPLSPSADGPVIVVGEVHHPVRAIESPAPAWLTIPERGLYTGVAIFRRGRVRQNVGVYAPVRPPALELASDESRAARGGAGP